MADSGFDVRNTVALTGQWRIGYSTVSLAYRFATGRPYTPVVGAVPSGTPGVFSPIYGAPYSERVPDFDRFDFSFNRLQLLGHQLWQFLFSFRSLTSSITATSRDTATPATTPRRFPPQATTAALSTSGSAPLSEINLNHPPTIYNMMKTTAETPAALANLDSVLVGRPGASRGEVRIRYRGPDA